MNNHDDISNADGANRRERERSRTRTSTKKTNFKEDPIKTLQEWADKSSLLGYIEFKDTKPTNGVVNLDNDQMPHIKSVWTEQRIGDEKIPSRIDIRSLKLGALKSMSRPNKRKMLRELAKEGKEGIEVRIIDESDLPKKFPKETVVSLATVLILHIGLQKREEYYDAGEVDAEGEKTLTAAHPDALFAELVGCADADTMKDLSDYLCPPLMTLEKLPDFIHCAIRQIARSQKEDRSPEPVALAIQTVNAISAALEQLNEEKKGEKKEKKEKKKEEKEERLAKLKSLLARTLSKAQLSKAANDQSEVEREARKKEFSRDLGCHAGLLLAGVQRYICKAQGSVDDKKELCDLFIDASSGLLTGIPAGGFVFGAFGPLAKFGAHKWYFASEARNLGQLSRGVRQYFDEFIAAPIFFDGEFEEKKESGEKKVVEVKWEEFSKWYDQVISWNEMQNEMMEWDVKEKRKQETKKKRKEKNKRQ